MTLRLELKVMPASGKSLCLLDKTQKIRCYLKSQAQDGKANKELIKLLAELCSVPQKNVDIVMGLISRHKVVLIKTEMSYEQFLAILGTGKQNSIF
jgi:uncharacterized protein (TIGR00251 family)